MIDLNVPDKGILKKIFFSFTQTHFLSRNIQGLLIFCSTSHYSSIIYFFKLFYKLKYIDRKFLYIVAESFNGSLELKIFIFNLNH